ncbi:hypothetical protein [Nocardioides sp. AE5]|uniref:hypothetical protein n=1 Tax=Nocardioides sp. AE5 TaxID=2962573 RepID=UPI00288129B8|nr:hypothetical protein [Nocardioides sp. AE5]MDT0202738.1 hypothetical protein [Nocardioides sp. AE5]
MDGEALEVTSAGGCHLNQQGQMMAAAKITGRNAAGEDVMLDFTRYRDDYPTPGDSIQFTIQGPDSVGWLMGTFDEGTVSMSDDVVAANDLEVSDSAGRIAVVSFEIAC